MEKLDSKSEHNPESGMNISLNHEKITTSDINFSDKDLQETLIASQSRQIDKEFVSLSSENCVHVNYKVDKPRQLFQKLIDLCNYSITIESEKDVLKNTSDIYKLYALYAFKFREPPESAIELFANVSGLRIIIFDSKKSKWLYYGDIKKCKVILYKKDSFFCAINSLSSKALEILCTNKEMKKKKMVTEEDLLTKDDLDTPYSFYSSVFGYLNAEQYVKYPAFERALMGIKIQNNFVNTLAIEVFENYKSKFQLTENVNEISTEDETKIKAYLSNFFLLPSNDQLDVNVNIREFNLKENNFQMEPKSTDFSWKNFTKSSMYQLYSKAENSSEIAFESVQELLYSLEDTKKRQIYY